jgi:hypothetical protein
MLHQGSWELPPRDPDLAHNGLEPDAVLVSGPQLHPLLRVGPPQGLDYGRKVFWKAAWAVGSAFTWRERLAGHRRDLGGSYPPSQQPDDLPVAAGDGIVGRPVPAL